MFCVKFGDVKLNYYLFLKIIYFNLKIYNKLTRKESLARWCECDPLIDYTNQSEDEDEDHKEEPWFLEEEENHEQKPEENHEIESEDYGKDSNEYHEKNSNEDDDENEKNDDYSMESIN